MKTIDVILLQPHTHADKAYPAGAPLALADRDAVWLVREGVARLAHPVPGLHINVPATGTPNNPTDSTGNAPAVTTDTDPTDGDHHE